MARSPFVESSDRVDDFLRRHPSRQSRSPTPLNHGGRPALPPRSCPSECSGLAPLGVYQSIIGSTHGGCLPLSPFKVVIGTYSVTDFHSSKITMSHHPLDVSIIVPCRNEKDHIEACVRSILTQQSPPGGFEIIVADGMSDDGTREILKRLVQNHSCLRVLDNPRRVTPSGMNVGIRAARGR